LLLAEVQAERRITAKVADPDQLEVFAFAKEKWNAWHMIAISAVDKPDGNISAVYHFDIRPPFEGLPAITLNLEVECPSRDNTKLTSVCSVIPGSQFFEREAHDLMGIVFEGNPNLERLILPEDFPDGVYPLRKDFLLEIQKEELAKKAKKK
jgi:NADH:ubiquinone oxidoreductase subunit C